ncbi:DUF805 domain-containing protein [Leeia sp.]|uniref:DUF805 domain-containing protein n=1 Tax=Leeia sp. TaxID=2884678 RepID=UPI0035B37CFD
MSDTVTLSLTGQVLPGHDVQQVAPALAALLKIPPEQAQKLLAGKVTVIRKALPVAQLPQYLHALTRIGADARVETSAPEPAATAPAPAPVVSVGKPGAGAFPTLLATLDDEPVAAAAPKPVPAPVAAPSPAPIPAAPAASQLPESADDPWMMAMPASKPPQASAPEPAAVASPAPSPAPAPMAADDPWLMLSPDSPAPAAAPAVASPPAAAQPTAPQPGGLSLVDAPELETPPPAEAPASSEMTCPACGKQQPKRTLCVQCGADMPRMLAARNQPSASPAPATDSPTSGKDIYASPSSPLTRQDDDGPDWDTPPLVALSLEGRIGRIRFMAYQVGASVLTGLMGAIHVGMALNLILGLLAFWITLRVWALRLHDLNLSSKWLLLPLLSVLMVLTKSPVMGLITMGICIIAFLLLLILPGSEDENEYGPPAGPNSVLVYIGAALYMTATLYVAYSAYQGYKMVMALSQAAAQQQSAQRYDENGQEQPVPLNEQ